MSINDCELAVAETREAYEHSEDIAFDPEREATTAFISALECLTSTQAAEIAALQDKVKALTGGLRNIAYDAYRADRARKSARAALSQEGE